MPPPVYLDHNATTPVRPEVVAAMAGALGEVGNPSSVHGFGRLARRRVEEARERVAELAGAAAAQVVFTSGGGEANGLALAGCGRRRRLVSAIEHESVLKGAAGIEIIPVRPGGEVDTEALARMLAEDRRPALVSVMMANNETGVVQPLAEVVRLAHSAGALVHCDAVQAAGRLRLAMGADGIDLMSLSAHKLGGPQGVGALVVADGVALEPQLRGGGQERGLRAGTENVAGIVGFGVAARLAGDGLAGNGLAGDGLAGDGLDGAGRLAEWRDRLEREALSRVTRALVVGAWALARLPNTTCLVLPGTSGEVQVMALDLAGVAVSAGSACSSGKVAPSHVLAAMGLEPRLAASAIRVSLGWTSREADVERFLEAWCALAARTGELVAASAA